MASTKFEIANAALSRIGVKQHIEDEEDDSAEALVFSSVYELVRDGLLEQFDWQFARRREVLAPVSGETRSGWSYVYAAPSKMVAGRGIWSGDRNAPVADRVAWTLEANTALDGMVLLTDQSSAEFIYTARVETVTAYPPLFVDALAWSLAREFLLGVAAKQQLLDAAERRVAYAIALAKRSALSQQQNDPPPESEFTRIRG